jgi:Holliday junction DNA helicase RuvA
MIVGVRGTLAATGPDWVHVTVGGVTLQVFVPSSSISALGQVGATVSLNTLLRIRDEQPTLYGFPDDASLQLFTLLTGVSGVGPRLGLALLSALDAASLQLAVASGDAGALSAAPGVGRRTANRIILELRGKVDAIESDGRIAGTGADSEVLAALAALGYSAAEARAAVDAIPDSDGLTVEDRIRLALQQFARR